MVDLPKKSAKLKPGQKVPGVVCPKCGSGIGLGGNVAGLPVTFPLSCPRCGHKATYRKVDIRTLEAHRLQ